MELQGSQARFGSFCNDGWFCSLMELQGSQASIDRNPFS